MMLGKRVIGNILGTKPKKDRYSKNLEIGDRVWLKTAPYDPSTFPDSNDKNKFKSQSKVITTIIGKSDYGYNVELDSGYVLDVPPEHLIN